MYAISVPVRIDGVETQQIEAVYTLDDFPWNEFEIIRIVRSHSKKKETPSYYNIESAFDIESTTLTKVDCNKYNKIREITYKGEGFMYHWQFCLKNRVIFGRTWEELVAFFEVLKRKLKLSDSLRLVIYVHNLPYEFQFLKNIFEMTEIFAKDAHKVIRCFCHRYGIEFRCSYFLSNMSLSKFCENSKGVRHYKLVDSYDYRKLRTPITPMTEEELGYCYNDVRGLCECIHDKRLDDNLAVIPLTSTGYVRRDFRKAIKADPSFYPDKFRELALTLPEYKLCKDAFRGGNTHANRKHAGKVIKADIGEPALVMGSMDISSSYPAQIAMSYYPMSRFRKVKIESKSQLETLLKNYCCIMRVQYKNLRIKENKPVPIPYIDYGHCKKHGTQRRLDNGRVLLIDYAEIPMTEIDYNIIRSQYDYDFCVIPEIYIAERGKLPDSLRNCMMEYFRAKSKLKGIPEKVYEYMKSKNKLNSTFGMMVTDLLQSEWTMEHVTGKWIETKPNELKALENYYSSYNSVLEYQWGIYVTAHARKQLQDMIDIVGDDTVYCDTDSIKFLHPEDHIPEFTAKNAELEKRAITNDIPAFCDVGENRYILGTWDCDDMYLQFKTLGAKKYCGIEWKPSNLKKGKDPCVFVTTVAGMNKKLGAENIKCPSNFRIGRVMENVGRTTSWFDDSFPHMITVDGCTFSTSSNIGILDTTYTLGITNEYAEVLLTAQRGD